MSSNAFRCSVCCGMTWCFKNTGNIISAPSQYGRERGGHPSLSELILAPQGRPRRSERDDSEIWREIESLKRQSSEMTQSGLQERCVLECFSRHSTRCTIPHQYASYSREIFLPTPQYSFHIISRKLSVQQDVPHGMNESVCLTTAHVMP